MIKKRYFTISKKGRYSSSPEFRFENLDGALEMFKYLMTGKMIEIEDVYVVDNSKDPRPNDDPKEDPYIPNTYLHCEVGESEYELGSEVLEVYTKEEIVKEKQKREDWAETFKVKKEEKK